MNFSYRLYFNKKRVITYKLLKYMAMNLPQVAKSKF
jgi:hypothetical protein